MVKTRSCKIEQGDNNMLKELINNPEEGTILQFIMDDIVYPDIVNKEISFNTETFKSTTNLSEKQIDTTYTIYSL